jgi:hypothetical protein
MAKAKVSSELKVEILPVEELIPYVNNAKEHTEVQISQIAASIKEFGFNDPIAIDETGTIIEGHGRLLAAQKLKLKTVPVIRLEHLTPAQKKAYMLAHNKLTMNTGFNMEKLKIEFDELKEMNFNVELAGFNIDEITDMNMKEFEPNIAEESNGESKSKFTLIITLDSEEEQQQLFDDLKAEGYKVKAG